METAVFAILIVLLIGGWDAFRSVNRKISAMTLKSNELLKMLEDRGPEISETLSLVDEIKEVLTEASRLKAMREAGKTPEIPMRSALRGKRFVGIAERRGRAERESLVGQAHQDMVHNNDIKAMEGK